MVTEVMETDLHRVIYSKQELSQEHICYLMYQMVRGLKYLHSGNIMHRDLKPSNLLVNGDCILKICDLGLARGYVSEEENKTEYVVTRWYRAPEVILQASEYTKAIDIWSAGVIFAEMLARTPLFPGKDYLEQVNKIIAVLGTPTPMQLAFVTNQAAHQYVQALPKRTKQSFPTLFPHATLHAIDLIQSMLAFNPNHVNIFYYLLFTIYIHILIKYTNILYHIYIQTNLLKFYFLNLYFIKIHLLFKSN